MSETIDILSFCRILTDLTNKDKCKWQPASHKSRDRLVFESGYFEITLYQETEQNKKCYCIDIYSNEDMQYMPFIAEKGLNEVEYKVFGDLYKSIWSYYDRARSKKIKSFYDEIMEQTSKK